MWLYYGGVSINPNSQPRVSLYMTSSSDLLKTYPMWVLLPTANININTNITILFNAP
jgi:hypothetical protein